MMDILKMITFSIKVNGILKAEVLLAYNPSVNKQNVMIDKSFFFI